MNHWDARFYRQHTGFVSDLGEPLLDLLGPRPAERILDVGCGDGVLTAKLLELGCEVVGIDTSPDMVSAARERGVDARVLDAVEIASPGLLEGPFDAVFSNAALHWMRPMDVVVRRIAGVLKPTGRFVAEFGGKGNIVLIRRAIYQALRRHGVRGRDIDPWQFPSPDGLAAMLHESGFHIDVMERFQRPTDLPTGLANWMESVAWPFLNAVAPEARRGLLAEVEDRLSGDLRRADGTWWADYVRLRVRAVRGPEP